MASIVGVHGIGKYRYFAAAGSARGAAEVMRDKWNRYLHAGLGGGVPYAGQSYVSEVAYYAHLLREETPPATRRDLRKMDPPSQLVLAGWMEQLGGAGSGAGETLTGLIHRFAEWLLLKLGPRAKDFAEDFCPEVAAYFAGADAAARVRSRDAVADAIRRNKPKVLIAHSLGSVVAYEALWAHPDLSVELFVTLGSPLAMRNVVFERLQPLPAAGRGRCPSGVRRWVNIADKDDIAAIPGALKSRFDGVTTDEKVNINWADFHTARNYLACGAVNEHVRPFLAS
ncbi:GPI inositol-deacylase [Sphaerisporangium perillae]|uniref:GPI inositol-deacylase n=1 Tax=Sphaerisporangium perillae TaxID=2935860 RepID=UPI00200D6C1D|nr:GPI inositol-deacylase [Sphaerisporangium perillae]